MKIHITNLYNFNSGDELVKRQHQFAEAGRSLGFLEMGIFSYPVETDTPRELSKRLDGIIAALEPEDVVFVQLPTENGLDYEQLFVRKIKAYKDTKVVLILHGGDYENAQGKLQDGYERLRGMVDGVVQAHERIVGKTAQKLLTDAVEQVYAQQLQALRMRNSPSEDEMHIGFGLYDKTGNYSVWVGTAMQSIIEHTVSPICFHILHDETLGEGNKEKLRQVATAGGHRVLFHFLDKDIFAGVAEQTRYFTIGTMFRIMLPELLPDLARIIYLDADILVNRDIKELWDIDISEYCLAAVPDVGSVTGAAYPVPVERKEVDAKRYFNAGVLYMNLDRIREHGNMRTQVLDYLIKTKESQFPDQDALNVLYNKDTLLLDASWNYFALIVRKNGERELQKRIYHFAATRCVLYSLTAMDRLYYETIGRTPWGAEECSRQLDKSFERTNDRVSQLEKVLLLIGESQKKHIFYGTETFAMKNLYSLLPPQEGDYRILSKAVVEKAPVLACKDFSVLEVENEPFIVFVLPEADNGQAMANLERLGLQNGQDFFVIPRLLSPDEGGYM